MIEKRTKICLMDQPMGLGDILYTQRIVERFVTLGYHVLYPVIKEYSWLNDYMSTDHVQFFSEEQPFVGMDLYGKHIVQPIISEGFCYIPLRYASNHPINKSNWIGVMESKYQFLDMLHEAPLWAQSLKFQRNRQKEQSLYYDVLGLKDGEDYIWKNSLIGSMNGQCKVMDNIKFENKGIRVVDHKAYEGYTMFDWCMVLERAKELHSPDGSTTFMAETLNLKMPKFLYPRMHDGVQYGKVDPSRCRVKHLFDSSWTLVD
jgi:hypothetical protein